MSDKVTVEVFPDNGRGSNHAKITGKSQANGAAGGHIYHLIERIAELESKLAACVVTDSSKVLKAALAENERLRAETEELRKYRHLYHSAIGRLV